MIICKATEYKLPSQLLIPKFSCLEIAIIYAWFSLTCNHAPSPPPPQAYPWGCPIFFFLGGLFLIPELLIYLKYIFYGYLFLIRTKAKWDVFTTFFTTFARVYWEKDDGCHYLVKTWTIHLKMKTKKKNSLKKRLLRRTLHKNTESLFIYMHQKPCICFHISCLFILKLDWRNSSVLLLQKNKIHLSMHHRHIRFKF